MKENNKLCTLIYPQLHATYCQPGADPEKNLTRAQPKARGCGFMGVALSMGSCRHDLVDAAQLSARLRYFNASTKNKLLKTELVLGGSVMSATANLMATAKCKEVEAVKKLSAQARGTLINNRDNAIRCKEALYQLFCEILGGQVAPVPHSSYVHIQMAVVLST